MRALDRATNRAVRRIAESLLYSQDSVADSAGHSGVTMGCYFAESGSGLGSQGACFLLYAEREAKSHGSTAKRFFEE